jgi:hypothetical protein
MLLPEDAPLREQVEHFIHYASPDEQRFLLERLSGGSLDPYLYGILKKKG